MKRRWMGGALIGTMLLLTGALWSQLPDRIPTHWNFRGEVDGWSERWPGAFFLPGIAFGIWLLLPFLRRLDPRRAHYERLDETFHLLVNLAVLCMAVIHALTLAAALG